MKKIFTLLILLLLLPVTALAAEGIKLFIGGQQITESGCYENQSGTWTKVDGTEPANGQFSYDAATFTLTLNEAEITNNQTVNVAEGYTYGGSVIAFSQTADVSLKIVVSQGRSTITGTGGIHVVSTTGNASLSIAGPGSLDVEPKGSNSGITLSSSKNMNLDIDGADVTASSPAQYGVYLISSTDASSTSTITVNNGSLTTGGNGYVGIYYYWSDTNNAGTSSLTVSGNAVVDTRNSRIMTSNSGTGVQVGAGSDGNGGIVFDGKSGTVYGEVELQEDLEIGEGETLTIPEGTRLTIPQDVTLTNHGTIIKDGTLDGKIDCQHHTLTKTEAQAPTCTEPGKTTYTATFAVDWAKKRTKTVADIPALGHHYENGYCTECGQRDPDYVDPINYYNIYKESVCDGVEVIPSKRVVREGGSILVYVEKDTARYTFDNFKVYYKRSYYGAWQELKEGTKPGEYPINNIWTHIYLKAEGAEEKDPTGIEQVEGVKVYTKDGSLYVQTPQREQVLVISMTGAVVKNEEQVGLKQYHGLQPGIYIVRVGDRAYKLRLY